MASLGYKSSENLLISPKPNTPSPFIQYKLPPPPTLSPSIPLPSPSLFRRPPLRPPLTATAEKPPRLPSTSPNPSTPTPPPTRHLFLPHSFTRSPPPPSPFSFFSLLRHCSSNSGGVAADVQRRGPTLSSLRLSLTLLRSSSTSSLSSFSGELGGGQRCWR